MAETADISFGELLKIRNTVGTKTYHQSLRKGSSEGRDALKDRKDVDSKKERDSRKEKKSKNAPVEVTSKKPMTRKRSIINTEVKARDPRFDSLAGKYNPELFDRSYSFLEDLQKKELVEQKKSLRNSTDTDLKKQTDVLESRLKLKERMRAQQLEKRIWKKKVTCILMKGS